ncbi:MAG: DUF6516 family protein [Chloroflexota bacterium]|nr:DUF6516 family protein [Chloroflexota bacterium]
MRIEAYFQQVREIIEACPVMQTFNVTFDKRGTHEGFIRGEAYLIDGSTLHLREFVDVESTVDRLVYTYQYMDSAQHLIFRYDNTGHHRKLKLPTYPHHKHAGSESNVASSSAPDLDTVLKEIESLLQLPA